MIDIQSYTFCFACVLNIVLHIFQSIFEQRFQLLRVALGVNNPGV